MAGISGIGATFTALNIKSGKATLQFELDQSDVCLLPELAKVTGQPVELELWTSQQQLSLADAQAVEDAAEDAAAPVLPMLELGA